jgi:hypothetical protein
MRFGIVNPFVQNVTLEEFATIELAMARAGLVNVDHGVVFPVSRDNPLGLLIGLAIMVYEFSLFAPPDRQAYFAIDSHLYAGHAVLYAFDKDGNEVDLPGTPRVVFMPSAAAVERNIQLGFVQRPFMAVNGVKTWEWPQPRK